MVSKKQVLKTFTDLVTIDSPSGKEAAVAKYITQYLRKLNVKVTRDSFKNLIAYVPGVGEPIMISAHMDTVEPGRGIKPIIKKDVIKTDGSTILGADDKAGVTDILEAVRYLRLKKIKHRPLELVFTREEETSLGGAFNLNYKKISARTGLVLDSCRPLGYITMSAPFIYTIDIKVKGRAAHAGAFPEKGINAIQIAAKAIADFKIGRINKSTTNNIGLIQGGSVRNSVPESVDIKAEARSLYKEKALEQVDIMNKAFKKHVRRYKARLIFKSKFLISGFSYTKTDPFIKKIIKTNTSVGFKTKFEKSGGASDANVFAGKGLKTIVIAYGGKGVHTTKETIKVSEMQRMVKFLVEFVKD